MWKLYLCEFAKRKSCCVALVSVSAAALQALRKDCRRGRTQDGGLISTSVSQFFMLCLRLELVLDLLLFKLC